jgi:hypothetical protein
MFASHPPTRLAKLAILYGLAIVVGFFLVGLLFGGMLLLYVVERARRRYRPTTHHWRRSASTRSAVPNGRQEG